MNKLLPFLLSFFILSFLVSSFFPLYADEPGVPAEALPETESGVSISAETDEGEWNEEDVEDFFETDGITVTATRSGKRLADTPVITEIITAEEVANAGAVNATDALQDHGLMYWSNSMGDYVMLQGMDQGRILYLVDGKRIAGRVSQRLNGQTLPLGRLDRVEIVKGPQSLQYGSEAIGGVINFISKKPAASFGLSAGVKNRTFWSYNDPATDHNPGLFDDFYPFREQTGSAAMELPIGPLRTAVSFEGSRGGHYFNEDESASVLGEYYRMGGNLDGVLPLGSSAELRAGGNFLTMKNDAKTGADWSLTENEYIRAGGYLEAEFFPSETGSVVLSIYDSFYSRVNDSFSGRRDLWTRGEKDENENLVCFEALAFYGGFSRLFLTGGFEAAYNTMSHYDFSKPVAVDREAVFVEADFSEQYKYSILGGVRVERNSQFGFTAAPKVSAMYYLDDRVRIFGGAGLGYRAPSFNELYREYQSGSSTRTTTPYIIEPNLEINPEYAVSFDAGAEYAGPAAALHANVFYTELFDELITVDSGEIKNIDGTDYRIDIRENRARSMRAGATVEGKINFLEYFFTSASYNYLFGWNRSDSVETHDHPAHTGKLKAGFEKKRDETAAGMPGINVYFQGNFFSPRGDGAYDAIKREDGTYYDGDVPRWTVDFHLNLSLGEHFNIHSSVNNITGNIYHFGPEYGPVLTLGADWKM